MGRKKRLKRPPSSIPSLQAIESELKQKQREHIKERMSNLFNVMGLEKASRGVLTVETKKQFKVYTSMARGWFKAHGHGVHKEKVKEAVILLNKLERMF